MFALEHTCDIRRMAAVGTNGRKQLASLYTAVPSLFLPMSPKATIANNFSMGRGYDVYFDDGQDVKVGDELVYAGNTYKVGGVQRFAGLPMVSHVHVAAEQEVS